MASLMDILAGAGNLLDLPGSSLRDILSGRNPFDQWATPFSDVNRASGRDVLQPFLGANEETGMAGWADNPMEGLKDIAGFGAEMLLDPLNLVPLGAVGKALKGRKAARSANAAMKAERGGKYAMVNPKVAGRVATEAAPANPMRMANWQDEVARLETDRLNLVGQADVGGFGANSFFYDVTGETPDILAQLDQTGLRRQYDELGKRIDEIRSQNPMKLLGYTPERPVVYHGGHDWSASATPENPYGMFDVSRLKTGEGANAFGPGAYFAEAESTSRQYRDGVLESAKEKMPLRQLMTRYWDAAEVANVPDRISTAAGNLIPEGPYREDLLSLNKWLQDNDWLGYDVSDPKEIRHLVEDVLEDPREWDFFEGMTPDIQNLLQRLNTVEKPKARLYQLDLPTEVKDKFVVWDNPMREQPSGVAQLIDKFNDAIGKDSIAKIEELQSLRSFYTTLEDDLLSIKAKRNLSDKDLARASSLESQVATLREQAADIQDDLLRAGVPRNMLKSDTKDLDSGAGLLEFFMKKNPGDASLSDTQVLTEAGVPGVKNLAGSTGHNTYNYAIWDQNLLNQMRIRAIDRQRVPINPTTLVEQVQQPVARAAESPLVSTMNPMQLQPEPSPFPAAVAGAVYNALQAFNGRGGIQ